MADLFSGLIMEMMEEEKEPLGHIHNYMAMKWRSGGVVVSALDLRLVVRDLDSVVYAVSLDKNTLLQIRSSPR